MSGDRKALILGWVLLLASFHPMKGAAALFIIGGVVALVVAKVLGCYDKRPSADKVTGQ